jgi:hypothetical protein
LSLVIIIAHGLPFVWASIHKCFPGLLPHQTVGSLRMRTGSLWSVISGSITGLGAEETFAQWTFNSLYLSALDKIKMWKSNPSSIR